MDEFTTTGNINDKWLLNIYQNIIKIEEYETLARDGCSSIYEYANMSMERRKIEIPETQFKNIKMMVTQFILLVGDLSPKMSKDTSDKFLEVIESIDKALRYNEDLFIERNLDVNRNLKEVLLLPRFNETIDILFKIKTELFRENKDILYIGSYGH